MSQKHCRLQVMEDVRNQLRLEHACMKKGTYDKEHLDFKLKGIVFRKAKELRKENGLLQTGKWHQIPQSALSAALLVLW